ncbi:discoidin domain-containing protein [Algoriphagus aquimarinus]|uniref:N-terminal ig-like domain of cellulase n=1 Tax=Algoriphagus aquimarinus TaxID=237018 RepID=A0A1I1CJ39_9BACT|nr:discoidin domain-containing protein [Algoriphagus aquimarinus]SFB60928.1 N-terminal ig-like domain of cellulase [Algoriphagus aquimarinus]
MKYTYIKLIVFALWLSSISIVHAQQNNLSLTGTASASSSQEGFNPEKAIDGKTDPSSSWKSNSEDEFSWLMVRLPGATEILRIDLSLAASSVILPEFKLQIMHNGTWQNVQEVKGNAQKEISLELTKPVLSDRIRFFAETNKELAITELAIYGQEYVDSTAMDVKKILVNQSGYNLNRPKRFSAPSLAADADFNVVDQSTGQVVFKGKLTNHVGDFSDFNPLSSDDYAIVVAEEESFPFRIGVNWMERVSYRNMVDFMIGSRHYLGTTDAIRSLSWAWRDGDFFNWAQQSLVSLYLSNPTAFERMEQTIHYVPNDSFSEEYDGAWGALEPYAANTPDIVQLIHWDADVKISHKLEHEMQKAELAYFLYAWPYLKQWLPQQNFDVVYAYLQQTWEKETVEEYSTTKYDLSPTHNLLTLKTKLGTTKGELPPGHSVIPNLIMFEAAKGKGDPEAQKYFDAAFNQLDWMIKNLDWNDPMTTKGQRMSEHITMRAFAFFFSEYPDKSPSGLKAKVAEWAKVAISRSDNYWDFRKFSEDEWTPPSWNETGNVLGLPAALFSAMSVLDDQEMKHSLEILAWSHFDNSFGRNPTGRHFSYRGPSEIEGVELGWYSFHKGGIGLLDEVKFVFDGSPKSFHYPNHPEVGDLGWTEGWVQFNTAFNTSMGYMANYYTSITMELQSDELIIKLKASLNFDPTKKEPVNLLLSNSNGQDIWVELVEESPYSEIYIGRFKITKGSVESGAKSLAVKSGDELTVKYGYGFMEKVAKLTIEN